MTTLLFFFLSFLLDNKAAKREQSRLRQHDEVFHCTDDDQTKLSAKKLRSCCAGKSGTLFGSGMTWGGGVGKRREGQSKDDENLNFGIELELACPEKSRWS